MQTAVHLLTTDISRRSQGLVELLPKATGFLGFAVVTIGVGVAGFHPE